jgi:ABC-type protease/lipase transport system fused ATPase/permease subunit
MASPPVKAQARRASCFAEFPLPTKRGGKSCARCRFRWPAGESAAIVGPSGAGKTTLLLMLPRFFDPARGGVELGGVDVRQWDLQDLRRQIGLVLQEPIILPATVAENIGYGKPGASAEEIAEAARAANALGFIEKLPEKFQTRIGEGAARLSAGERQRINLARAFLKDAPIILLDEPTSALDGGKRGADRGESAGVVARAHGAAWWRIVRPPSPVFSGWLVLEDGRLTEFGTPENCGPRRDISRGSWERRRQAVFRDCDFRWVL